MNKEGYLRHEKFLTGRSIVLECEKSPYEVHFFGNWGWGGQQSWNLKWNFLQCYYGIFSHSKHIIFWMDNFKICLLLLIFCPKGIYTFLLLRTQTMPCNTSMTCLAWTSSSKAQERSNQNYTKSGGWGSIFPQLYFNSYDRIYILFTQPFHFLIRGFESLFFEKDPIPHADKKALEAAKKGLGGDFVSEDGGQTCRRYILFLAQTCQVINTTEPLLDL